MELARKSESGLGYQDRATLAVTMWRALGAAGNPGSGAIQRSARRRFLSAKKHYVVLQVSPCATKADIKLSYLRLAKRYHPDVNSDPSAASMFQEVSAAYEILGDDEKRSTYDLVGDGAPRNNCQ